MSLLLIIIIIAPIQISVMRVVFMETPIAVMTKELIIKVAKIIDKTVKEEMIWVFLTVPVSLSIGIL